LRPLDLPSEEDASQQMARADVRIPVRAVENSHPGDSRASCCVIMGQHLCGRRSRDGAGLSIVLRPLRLISPMTTFVDIENALTPRSGIPGKPPAPLLGRTRDKLEVLCAALGAPPYRGRQLASWIYR